MKRVLGACLVLVLRPAFAQLDVRFPQGLADGQQVPLVLLATEKRLGEAGLGAVCKAGFAVAQADVSDLPSAIDAACGRAGVDADHLILLGVDATADAVLRRGAADERIWLTAVQNADLTADAETVRRVAPRRLYASVNSAGTNPVARAQSAYLTLRKIANAWNSPWKPYGLQGVEVLKEVPKAAGVCAHGGTVGFHFGAGAKGLSGWDLGQVLAFARRGFEAEGGAFGITDVFAETSVRKRRLSVETEVRSDRPRTAELRVEVRDPQGKPFQSFAETVSLRPGLNIVRVGRDCPDFTTWEVGRPALYTASVSLRSAAVVSKSDVTFGFRELWTEGREILMNGHLQRFRPTYSFCASEPGIRFMASIGFNELWFCHRQMYQPDIPTDEQLDALDRLGVAACVPVASLNLVGDKVRDESLPETRRYLEWLKRSVRRVRNHPCVVQAYVSLIYNGSVEATYAPRVGQVRDTGPQVANMDAVAAKVRPLMPGVLLSGFGDCNTLDVASGFCYLNWTPLQEREDWLSSWSEKGVMPISFPEFGHPYKGNWFVDGKTFCPTEWMAPYFGDRAYFEEDDYQHDRLYDRSVASGRHGAQIERELYPLWNDFSSLFIRRTTRAWRTWGENGGIVNFCLDYGYGRHPKWSKEKYGKSTLRTNYSLVDDYVSGRPDWANGDYDNFHAVNQPFLGYVGGAEVATDKKHAYFAGREVRKDLVFVWDGFGPKTVTATWSAEVDGRRVAGGDVRVSLRQGDILKRPISFRAPEASRVVRGRIAVTFAGEGLSDDAKDEFPLEVHPDARPRVANARTVALVDPDGLSAPLLRKLGVPYRLLAPDAPLGDVRDLVIGRFALEKSNLPYDERDLAAGLNVLVLAQRPGELKNLGLRVEDRMSRVVFLRDRSNPAFAGIDDASLHDWDGAPDYGALYGNLCEGDTTRYRHWTYRHVVAGVQVRIPEKAGFVPLMDGEFDLNYSPLLAFGYGKGSLTFCTLDLENRADGDPNPLKAAAAVFTDFFAPRKPHLLGVRGNAALVARLGLRPGDGLELLVGGAAARAAGLRTKATEFRSLRHPVEDHPLLRGVGPSLLRLREKTEVETFVGGDGWTVLADGLLATKGTKIAFAVDPLVLERRHDAEKDPRGRLATFLSTERQLQFVGRVLVNAGAQPAAETARRLVYQAAQKRFAPLKSYFVLGPFASKDDPRAMLDTVFSGEESAIRGDNAPEREYPLPQGGTANWRTTAFADDEGTLDFRAIGPAFRADSFPVNYAICYLERKTSEPAAVEFNCDWRAKVWCNGEPVFVTDRGVVGGGYSFRLENLKAGRNVLAFKIGSGRSGCTLTARVTPEAVRGAPVRREDPELERYRLYELGGGRAWDEYQHRFW